MAEAKQEQKSPDTISTIVQEFNSTKDMLFKNQIQKLYQIENTIQNETHPRFIEKLARPRENLNEKEHAAQYMYQYQLDRIEKQHETEILSARNEFTNDFGLFRERLRELVDRKREAIEEAREHKSDSPALETSAIDVVSDITGKFLDFPMAPALPAKHRRDIFGGSISPTFEAGGGYSSAPAVAPAQARRRLGTNNPQMKAVLTETEINEDFAVMHRNVELTTRFAGGEVKTDRSRLVYHNHLFEQGDSVVFETPSTQGMRCHGIITVITDSEVFIQTPDGTRHRLSHSHLKNGKCVIYFEVK